MNFEEAKREFFVKYCATPTYYFPEIIVDDVWNHLFETMTDFSYREDYKKIDDCLANIYNNDLDLLKKDIISFEENVAAFIDSNYEAVMSNRMNVGVFGDLPQRIMDVEDGKYISLDLKNAILQVINHYSGNDYDIIENESKKYKCEDVLKQVRGLRKIGYGFAKTRLSRYKFLYENLIKESVDSDCGLIKDIKNNAKMSCIAGDSLLFLPNENTNIEQLNNDYAATNGVVFHIGTLEVKTHTLGSLTIKEKTSNGTDPIYYSNCISKRVPSELYPQIYKKTRGIPIQKQDMAYGELADVKYFTKKIWEY